MKMQQGVLWAVWAVFVAVFALGVATPFFFGPTSTPYSDAGIQVLGFVLALLATTAGVGSLASRESLLKAIWAGRITPGSAGGVARMLRTLLGTWALCLFVGGMGVVMAFASAKPASQWPYGLASGALLAFHSPRAGRFRSPRAAPAEA
jgi:hypothetical protein